MGVAFDITNDGTFVGQFRHSRENNSGWMQEMANINGAIQTRQYNMGGSSNADVNNLARLTSMSSIGKNAISFAGVIITASDVRTREQQLKNDITRAFGSEVAYMGDFIAEVMNGLGEGSNLTQDQQDQLFEMVTKIIELKNLMNKDPSAVSAEELEATILDIAEKLLDGIDNKAFSKAIIDFTHGLLNDVQQAYNLPALDALMAKIEGKMNPENYLMDATAEMLLQLQDILDNQELSEEAQAEIEELIEKLQQAIDNGEPLPIDVIRALDSLSETYPDVSLSTDFTNALDTLKDARTTFIAEKLDVSATDPKITETSIDNSSDNKKSIGLATMSLAMEIFKRPTFNDTSNVVKMETRTNTPTTSKGNVFGISQNDGLTNKTQHIEVSNTNSAPAFTDINNTTPSGIEHNSQKPPNFVNHDNGQQNPPSSNNQDDNNPPKLNEGEPPKDDQKIDQDCCKFCQKIETINEQLNNGENVSNKELGELVGDDIVQKFTREEIIEYLNDYKQALQILQDNNIKPEDYSSKGSKLTNIREALKDLESGKGHICGDFCEHSNPTLAAAVKTLETINTDFYTKTRSQQLKDVQSMEFSPD